MNWFRRHLRHGSRLALFALAIQFALSFGHSHGFVAQAATAIATGLTQVDFDDAKHLATPDTANQAEQKQRPALPDSDSADACAICAVVSLAGNVLFSTPPLLQMPQAVEFRYLTVDAEFVHLSPVHPAFRSRAPPAS
jgi:hypothetical protein